MKMKGPAVRRFTVRWVTCLTLWLAGVSAALAAPGDDFENIARRILALYGEEQFATLDRELDEMIRKDEALTTGASATTAAYRAFRIRLAAPGVAPAELDRIKRWQAAIPGSPHALFAESRYWYANAWNQRGTDFAPGVKNEAWSAFRDDLRRAQSLLLESPKAASSPLAQNLQLAISQDLEGTKVDPDDVVKSSVAKWPHYYDFFTVRLTRLVPRWGGSAEAVEDFISAWSTRQAKLEGDSLYARLQIFVDQEGLLPASRTLNWPRLKASFRELVERYPDPRFRNLLASYSCRVRDAEEYRRVLASLRPEEIIPTVWLRESSYQSCQALK